MNGWLWGLGSNEIELVLEFFAELFVLKDFGVESGALSGVLEDAWDFDGAGPVDVVEALGEDQFLEHSFLEFAVG